MPILPTETRLVDHMLRRLPSASSYRLRVDDQAHAIEVYARTGIDLDDMLATFGGSARPTETSNAPRSGFRPVLRWVLLDATRRIFRAERWQPERQSWEALPEFAAAPLPDLAHQTCQSYLHE